MSYEIIYKTSDGMWHFQDCDLLKNKHIDKQIIGSRATLSNPPLDKMCKKCWDYLFKENKTR